FMKKDKNIIGRLAFKTENHTLMKPKRKHTDKENINIMKILDIKRKTYKNNLGNENNEEAVFTKLKVRKIKNSHSTSKAEATLDIKGFIRKYKELTVEVILKKEDLKDSTLKRKEKDYFMNNIEKIVKDRVIKIDKAEGNRKIKALENY
ncbi:29159_t:CDS:2, partial [Gigaspora margarita]